VVYPVQRVGITKENIVFLLVDFLSRWKKHQKQTWFENYYHDPDIKYS
jgi:hypothetical protein